MPCPYRLPPLATVATHCALPCPLLHALSPQAFKDGWFTEKCTLWPGQGLSLQYDEVLYQAKSDFQVGIDITAVPYHSS